MGSTNGGWLSGLLSGYMDRHHHYEQQERDDAERRAKQEATVYNVLLNDPNPEVRHLATTGILELAGPRKRKNTGMGRFIGELETSPTYARVAQYFNTPEFKKFPAPGVSTAENYKVQEPGSTPGTPSVPSPGGAIPQTPPPSAALPGQAATQGAPVTPVQPAPQPAPQPQPQAPAAPSRAGGPGPGAAGAAPSRGGGPGGALPQPSPARRTDIRLPPELIPQPAPSQIYDYTPGAGPTDPETRGRISGFDSASGSPPEVLPPPAPPAPPAAAAAPPPAPPGTIPAAPGGPTSIAGPTSAAPPPPPPGAGRTGEWVYPSLPGSNATASSETAAKTQAEIQANVESLTWAFQQAGDDPTTARQKAVKAVAEEFTRGRGTSSGIYIKGGRVPNPQSPTGWSREMVLRTDPTQKVLITEQPPGYLDPLDAGERLSATLRLQDRWNATSLKARDALTAVDKMKAAYAEYQLTGKIPPTAEVIQVLFQKALDPDSVVRETEANRPGTFQSFLTWAQGRKDAFIQGGGIIRTQDLPDYIRIAEAVAQAQAMRIEDEGKFLERYATEIGLDPRQIRSGALITPNVAQPPPVLGAPAAPVAPAAPATPTPTTPAPATGAPPTPPAAAAPRAPGGPILSGPTHAVKDPRTGAWVIVPGPAPAPGASAGAP